MTGLEGGTLARARAKGPKPIRAGNHPDKHHRARSRWVEAEKARKKAKKPFKITESQGDNVVLINGVSYRYRRLPYSKVMDGIPPCDIILDMSPEERVRFGVEALISEEGIANILDGTRAQVSFLKKRIEVPKDLQDIYWGDESPVQRRLPNIRPEPTLDDIREELLFLLRRAYEKALEKEIIVKKIGDEEVEIIRKGSLSKGERKQIRKLKMEYREKSSGIGMLIPAAIGSGAWIELLEKQPLAA
ncbi:MAG: hypothetical protein Q8P68_00475 [Candidatus Peregrinibacteria bacterium]|nr:hypothetical protein [Candidatus Peregrinibacteria bacterium]MDZ4245177.1 hypothetical protein [Candidatus Gracilibacteria bacterium]